MKRHLRAQTQAPSLTTAAATTAARFIGPAASGGYRDGNFVFELCATECLVEMQILIQEVGLGARGISTLTAIASSSPSPSPSPSPQFADIKNEAHESYEVREGVVGFCALS